MHKLFAKQLAKATSPSGDVDMALLGELVSAALEDADRDRRRTDRSIALMVEELDQLNRGLQEAVEDRTRALHEREAELKAQNLRFHAAVSHMSHGLTMFDSEGRLIICNQRFLEMYKLDPELAKPGTPIGDILHHRIKSGTFAGNPDSYAGEMMARLISGTLEDRMIDLPDGRIVAISTRLVPQNGWVSTHEDITERRRTEMQIAHMARHDALTDLPNRLLLREWLTRALSHVHRGQCLAVHYLDLDFFKNVNDTLGHPIGDELLRVVAMRLRTCLRETDIVARIGGDEFAIVQTGINSPADAAILAQQMREAINAPYTLHGHVAIVDSSIGIALAPGDGDDPNTLMKNADMALYRAKADGRGTYRFFEPEMDARMHARRELELALRRALPAGEFELFYQPVVNLADDSIVSCEALIRWNHPERGKVSPAEFIPVAEEIGMIIPIGDWVVHQACADAVHWPSDVKVAINLSPTQLTNPSLLPVIINALAASRLPAHRFVAEITEAVLMQSTEATMTTLHRLREMGVQIALDDFGTGFSSLSYLRSFPFDKLKIDRCFISGLAEAEDSRSIVRAVTGLAQSLRMATTAEGVETNLQLEHVRQLGCTEMQGYFFSPPVPARELPKLFARTPLRQRGAA